MTFVKSYIADEYKTWQMVHSIEDYHSSERIILDFEKKYFDDQVFSDISRPGDYSSVEFAEFAKLISTKRARTIYCVKALDQSVFRAVLGSSYIEGDGKFEIIQIEKSDRFKITAQYLTNFDGTFSHVGGVYLGELMDDPCPEIQ